MSTIIAPPSPWTTYAIVKGGHNAQYVMAAAGTRAVLESAARALGEDHRVVVALDRGYSYCAECEMINGFDPAIAREPSLTDVCTCDDHDANSGSYN